MVTWINVKTGYKVSAKDNAAALALIKANWPESLQYDWRDVTNHPAAIKTWYCVEELN